MKATTLQELKFKLKLTSRDLAQKVGVSEQTLSFQLRSSNPVKHTIKYMDILGVNSIAGFENGVYVKINLS